MDLCMECRYSDESVESAYCASCKKSNWTPKKTELELAQERIAKLEYMLKVSDLCDHCKYSKGDGSCLLGDACTNSNNLWELKEL